MTVGHARQESLDRVKQLLSEWTTWGVGGPADRFLTPHHLYEAREFIRCCCGEGMDFFVLGGGSNVLVSDRGFRGAVLHTPGLDRMEVACVSGGVEIVAECGLSLRKVFSIAHENGWSGLEFAVAIPGTVGGTLNGNAGSRMGSIGECVEWIEALDVKGVSHRIGRREMDWDYRRCGVDTDTFVFLERCCLKLACSTREEVRRRVSEAAKLRSEQPYAERSAGCVFKNPPGQSAGYLLDQAGCKGLCVGDACVSGRHANFIVNRGNARADDIWNLARLCRERVLRHAGIELEYEVRLIGEFKES